MKHHITLVVNVSFFCMYICPLAETEVYTAIADLGRLLLTDMEIAKVLNTYLASEEDKIRKVKLMKEQYEKLYFTALQDEEPFLSNPINAYLLVKRLSQDWEVINQIIDNVSSRDLVKSINFTDLLFPDKEDLTGAATALLRLQDTYLSDTTELAKGEIAGAKSRALELSAGDCFQLGVQALELSDYKRSIQWMKEALIRYDREDIKTTAKPAILEFLAHCAFQLNHIRHAIKITHRIIELDPQHPRAYENLNIFQSYLNLDGDMNSSDEEYDEYTFPYSSYDNPNERDSSSLWAMKRVVVPAFDDYEKLCRGERTRSHRAEIKLKCQYTTNDNSYLLLQPVKQEILSFDPFICIYHDIISEKDAEIFKELSLPLLQRATVSNSTSGMLETASYRVSKSAWLPDTVHPRVSHASEFIKDITGLETDTAEALHIINYGIGGHYEPHYDFKMKDEIHIYANMGTGNRLATWIYYLSDVDAGGATVFPRIGVSVKPKKGSAAFWYNLRKNGDGELKTIHAGCPVLSGSKWVGNKWLHEVNNEFRRKCSLNSLD